MKEVHQKISQFLDDELHHTELDSLLLKIKQQPQLKNKMNRYQTIRHLLKVEDVLIANDNFVDNISQAINQQPHHFLPQQAVKKRSFGFWPKTSLALAASVAIIAVSVSRYTNVPDMQAPQIIAQNKAIEAPVKTASVSRNIQHERFKAYLQAHTDDLYLHGSLNYQPLAQVANFSQK